jgi:hypothetical protein
MPRNMSFLLTIEQVKNKTKTVTRRLGWWFLKPGDILNAVEKCQGLKKGEKIKKICKIVVISTNPERLWDINQSELVAEGFPNLTSGQFIEMFCKSHKGCNPKTLVNRIKFKYV